MSNEYRIAEEACYRFNKNTGGGVKAKTLRKYTLPLRTELLPGSFLGEFRVGRVLVKGYRVFVIRQKHKEETDRAVLYLPGGGGIARPDLLHHEMAKRLVRETGATLYYPYYPLAPENNVQDALDWLEGIYAGILRRFAPEKVTIIGDSVGANLALSLTARLSKKPGGVIAISPASGLADPEARNMHITLEQIDPLQSAEVVQTIWKQWAMDVPQDSPDVSPEYIDYTDFPKMLFIYGTHDLFVVSTVELLHILDRKKIPYESISKPMYHNWALHREFPESKEAMARIHAFIAGA